MLRTQSCNQEGTFDVHVTRPSLEVSADGAGVVSHVGSRLLADLADQTTLTGMGRGGYWPIWLS